tara:strand:- start:316 stop:489 length:174 start_codon:yes stop_codon:yes gene_type:complete
MISLRIRNLVLQKPYTFHSQVEVLSIETTDTENEIEVLNKGLQPSHNKKTWKSPKTL